MEKAYHSKLHYELNKEVTIESLIPENEKYHFIAAEVGGRLRELTYKVKGPADITLLPLKNQIEAQNIYKNSLLYMLAMVMKKRFPHTGFTFENDVSRSVYVSPKEKGRTVTPTELRNIYLDLVRLANEDKPIERKTLSKEEAAKLYTKLGMKDKTDILTYRPEPNVHLYVSDDYADYYYGKMVPSTGYIKKFNLVGRAPGFLIQYPRADFEGEIPPFEPEPKYEKTLQENREWTELTRLDTIAHVNDYLKTYGSTDFIMMSEAKISNQLSELGKRIVSSPTPIKVICIAGPSSSSKTTFANRLRLELLSRGMFPIRISCDDYYKEKRFLTPLPDGSYDLETIDAIDVALFNQQMKELSEGQEVTLPHYNFQTGKREEGRKLRLEPNQPLIVEGIHALNSRMTESIPSDRKFKVFIAPQAQVSIDDHNPISVTDYRLIRRIVRDSKFRNASAEETITMWPSVRRGEFNWIYATQEEADYVFNSFLPYELNVMKKYAMPMLEKITKDSPTYPTCRRLMLFLKYFLDMDDEEIPDNSLIREFIGGSCFKDV